MIEPEWEVIAVSKTEDIGLKDRICEAIRDRIFRLEFIPGEKLPEQKLAEEYGVSRPIVREAIRRLAWEGLIHIEPNRASTVVVMDEKLIQDLAFVRWQHDQLAIPLAVYRASAEDLDALRKLALACIEANEAGDLERRHSLDADFHRKIYALSGNSLLCDLQERLNSLVRLWQAQHIREPSMLAEGLKQHLALIDCFEAGDIAGALRVIQAHSTSSFGADFKGRLLTPQDILNLQRSK
ncbi:MAG: GntR family transcriptional regulator [Oscillospiraceae bacterium]|nr:GntR family transcriptional regulator [Oscillospiraceae bacterium]